MSDALLVVREGVQPGREIALAGALTIGRAEDCDVVLTDVGVSRRHARVTVEGEEVTVEDLGSSNGTFVNAELVEGSRALRDGDVVQLGTAVLGFVPATAEDPDATEAFPPPEPEPEPPAPEPEPEPHEPEPGPPAPEPESPLPEPAAEPEPPAVAAEPEPQPMPAAPEGALEKVSAFVWGKVPNRVSRLSPAMGATLADSPGLSRWPIAALAPAVVVIAGYQIGSSNAVTVDSFTASLSLVCILIGGAMALGGALGTWFTVGFAVGDYLRDESITRQLVDGFQQELGLHLGLLVYYAALFLLIAQVPLVSTMLRQRANAKWDNVLVAFGFQMALGAALAYLWSQAVPLFLRPVLVWPTGDLVGGQLPFSAIVNVQTNGAQIAAAAAAGGAVRVILERIGSQPLPAPAAQAEPLINEQLGTSARWARALLSAIALTLLLGGLAAETSDLALLFAMLLGAAVLRIAVLPTVKPYMSLITRIPMLLRLAIPIAVAAVVARALLAPVFNAEEGTDILDFQPLMIAIGVGILAGALALPDESSAEPEPAQ